MEKECKSCHQLKSLDMFYRHPKMSDGHLNHCAECVKKRVHKHRKSNIERIKQYDRERRRQDPLLKEKRIHFYQLGATPAVRRRARIATGNAIRDGKLIRPSACSQCGKECQLEAHHDDYNRPLDVRWLCRSCHCKHHQQQVAAYLHA